MTEGQFLVELIHMELDHEARVEQMCGSCQTEMTKPACSRCGKEKPKGKAVGGWVNPNFDPARFEKLKRGEA